MSPLVRMPPSAMIGTPFAAARRVHHGGQLRHADAGNDPRRANRARADPDLDRVRTRVGERLCGIGGGDIAGDDLDRVRHATSPARRPGDVGVVAVRGVDDDAVAAGIDQRL